MRKNTRKIFVFFLALCITCASISFPVYAGNGANKSVDSSAYIVVNGKTLYAFDYYNGTVTNTIDGLSYDENSNTLTLNNYDQPDSVITVNEMGEDFNIQVNGTNSILQLSVWGFGYGGSCYLKGSGSLTVNKKKSADIAIILNSEKSNSKFQVASSVILKAYSKSGNPVIGMDSSTCSTNGIYFEDTSFNKNVVAGSHTTDKTCTAVDTGEKWMLYACTRNNDATHTYGAQKRMTSDGQEYYVIFQITNDATYGNIAKQPMTMAILFRKVNLPLILPMKIPFTQLMLLHPTANSSKSIPKTEAVTMASIPLTITRTVRNPVCYTASIHLPPTKICSLPFRLLTNRKFQASRQAMKQLQVIPIMTIITMQNPSAQKKILVPLDIHRLQVPRKRRLLNQERALLPVLSARKNSLRYPSRRFLPSNCPLLPLLTTVSPLNHLLQ